MKQTFTCTITILNSFVPSTVLSVLGMTFVFVNTETGEKYSFLDLHFRSYTLGFIFCIMASLLYFLLIRCRKIAPRWWSTLLLVIVSYAFVPIHTAIFGANDFGGSATPLVGHFLAETLFLSALGFICIAVLTRQASRRQRNRESIRFRSPLWLLVFSLIQYLSFFVSAIGMSMLMANHLLLSANISYFINHILRWPLYTPFTKDFIASHLSGPAAHLVFIANAFIWGTVIWLIIKFRKNQQPLQALEPASDGAAHR